MADVSLTAELKSSDDSIKQSGILKISCNTPPKNLTGQGHCKMFVLEQYFHHYYYLTQSDIFSRAA